MNMSSSDRSSPIHSTRSGGLPSSFICCMACSTATALVIPLGLISTVKLPMCTSTGYPTSKSSRCASNSLDCQTPKSGSALLKCHTTADSLSCTNDPSVASVYVSRIGIAIIFQVATSDNIVDPWAARHSVFPLGRKKHPCSAARPRLGTLLSHSPSSVRDRPLTTHTLFDSSNAREFSSASTSTDGGMASEQPLSAVSVPS
mmetsp:Transcript_24411/g.46254  ORF Transcript_24411/g.46254 Transcript_24411/m.46254 type:complete len:202 (-) Transcript_24411:2189-2794(-)